MSEPTQHSAPSTQDPTPRRVWRPTFLQARLAVLMMALVCGVVGIAQGQPRLVIAGITFGVIGVLMRLYLRFKSRGSATMLLVALSATLGCGAGPTSEFTPRPEIAEGEQLIVVYIGATFCVPCQQPSLKAAVRQMKPLLQAQADSTRRHLSTVGVSLDWDVPAGLSMLEPITEYSEVIVGSNWLNSGVERFIWADTTAPPSLPQVVLVARQVEMGARVTLSGERLLARFDGASAIEAWVRQGARIPADAPASPPASE